MKSTSRVLGRKGCRSHCGKPANRTSGPYVSAKWQFLLARLLAALRGLGEHNLPNMVGNVKTLQILAFISEANITQSSGSPPEPAATKR